MRRLILFLLALVGGASATACGPIPHAAPYPQRYAGTDKTPGKRSSGFALPGGGFVSPTDVGKGGSGGGLTTVTTSGAGLSGAGTGGNPLVNSGVTSAVAGTAIGVSGATGAVTISNTGVTSCVSGTGVSCSASTGAVTVSANLTGGTAGAGQAIGTLNADSSVAFTKPDEARARTFIKEDFAAPNNTATNGLFADGGFLITLSGTSAAASVTGEAGHDGIVQFVTGTTTTGRGSVNLGSSTNQPILLGGGAVTVDCIMRVPTLSNGTDTYSDRCGLIDAVNADSTDGVYFKYDQSASTNWRCETVSNGTSTGTVVDTSPAQTVTAAAWFHGRIHINAAATSATFDVVDSSNNETQVCSLSSNIPSGASRQTGLGAMCLKSAGTTSTSCLDVDLIEYDDTLTTGR